MDNDEYRATHEGRTGADRMAPKLAIIPDKPRGDMDEVNRLRDALSLARQYIGGEFGFDNWRIEKIDARCTGVVGDESERRTELTPCPLCTGNARDRGYGISCEDCGLWLGNGTQAYRLGGYKAVWNRRATAKISGETPRQ